MIEAARALRTRVLCGAIVALAALLVACSGTGSIQTPQPSVRRPALWALLINGGGSKQKNYQSHLLHVRRMLAVLSSAGVPRDHVFVFASDGLDPEPDLAVREVRSDAGFWLIADLPLGRRLAEPIRFENTDLEGVDLRPATKQALEEWLESQRGRMHAGDTLLVYVTDHGSKNKEDLENNRIVLWGGQWSVSEFRDFLARLPEGVRTVALMSQCYSGSFAGMAYEPGDPNTVSGKACGYFSSTASRQAYGCYPENLGRNNVGHSFRFLEALAYTGRMPAAHERTVWTDRTPDVPNRSSDLFARKLLEARARAAQMPLRAYVDRVLSEGAGESVAGSQAIERIARRFGLPASNSLEGLLQATRDLPGLARRLRSVTRRWRVALADLERANFERFLARHAEWRPRLQSDALADLDDAQRRALSGSLLAVLRRYTRKDRGTMERLTLLRDRSNRASRAAYRSEVRHAAALRIQTLLMREAANIELARATESERRAYRALVACEDLRLPAVRPAGRAGRSRAPRRERASGDAFGSVSEDLALLERLRPGWLGVEFASVGESERAVHRLAPGAVQVRRVLADSPAERAGLLAGDIVVGPPGRPFHEPNRLREWVMTTPPGRLRTLSVLRDGAIRQVAVRIGAAPL